MDDKINEKFSEIRESLARIEEQNKIQSQKLDKIELAVFGNGHAGLTTRVQILEENQSPSNAQLSSKLQALEDRHKNGDRQHSSIIAWAAIFVSVLSAIMQFFQKST